MMINIYINETATGKRGELGYLVGINGSSIHEPLGQHNRIFAPMGKDVLAEAREYARDLAMRYGVEIYDPFK